MIPDFQHYTNQRTVIPQEPFSSIDPLENQLCRVCDEKAAGFHFGAFTCEGCKSFFGRFCNNQTVIPECKNNYACVIDKRNRTACKACRLKKCLSVGMSKSGCRYGRRSNWFKIHCLLQKNGQKSQPKPLALPTPHYSHTMTNPPIYPKPVKPTVFQILPPKPHHTSSRSPSPLNTSTESGHSSLRSNSSSPQSTDMNMRQDHFQALPTPPSQLSSLYPPIHPLSHPTPPMFDPLSLYRLSPLLVHLNPALLAAAAAQQQQQQQQQLSHSQGLSAMDSFKQQLDLLAERRALFEKLQKEAMCSSPNSQSESSSTMPVDLSVK